MAAERLLFARLPESNCLILLRLVAVAMYSAVCGTKVVQVAPLVCDSDAFIGGMLLGSFCCKEALFAPPRVLFVALWCQWYRTIRCCIARIRKRMKS